MTKENKSEKLIHYLEGVAEKDRAALGKLKKVSVRLGDIQDTWNSLDAPDAPPESIFLSMGMYLEGISGLMIRLGERSLKIDQSIKDANPDVPWDRIKGLRDSLAHMHEQITNNEKHYYQTLLKTILDVSGSKELTAGQSPPLMRFYERYSESTDPDVVNFNRKIIQLYDVTRLPRSEFVFKDKRAIAGKSDVEEKVIAYMAAMGVHMKSEDEISPDEPFDYARLRQFINAATRTDVTNFGFDVSAKEKDTLEFTVDHAARAQFISAAEHFRSLSDIFKNHHAVVKNTLPEREKFPNIPFMSDARNALAHNFYHDFIAKIGPDKALPHYMRFLNMQQVIDQQYLRGYNAKKAPLSVTGENYYDVLFLDKNKKIPHERLKQFERMVDRFVAQESRDINKEVTYMQAMLRISSALPAHEDFEAVVSATLDFIYDNTVPSKNPVDPSTHPQALQINTILNRIFRYQNDTTLWSMVGPDGEPLGKPATAKSEITALDPEKLDGNVDDPKGTQVHSPSNDREK